MRIEETVEWMSKLPLHRVIDSFTRDLHKPDLDESRQIIIRNARELADPEHIAAKLHREGTSFQESILLKFTLLAFLDAEEPTLTERHVAQYVTEREWELVQLSELGDAFRYKEDHKVDTYRTVLEVALDDDKISRDEFRLLTRLRRHLGLQERDHYLLQAELGKFPKPGNERHTRGDVAEALNELQRRGVVFYCNHAPQGQIYVVPEEIVPGLKHALDVELNERAYQLMLTSLTVEQLKSICEAFELPAYGTKDTRAKRVIEAGVQPSDALAALSADELYDACNSLPGVKVSGSKETKIGNIIEHFDKLKTVAFAEGTDEREKFYEYYEQLAKRDLQNLLSNKIVKKSEEIGRAFEEATRYLFEERLNLSLAPLSGSEHPDGLVRLNTSGNVFMWDTKSDEDRYTFPNTHLKQFKRYVRDSEERVSCFLVIAPEIDESSLDNAFRLKAESKTDTDVALIAADDLKQLAEDWADANGDTEFNLEVLNYTGILDWQTLQGRLRVFKR